MPRCRVEIRWSIVAQPAGDLEKAAAFSTQNSTTVWASLLEVGVGSHMLICILSKKDFRTITNTVIKLLTELDQHL